MEVSVGPHLGDQGGKLDFGERNTRNQSRSETEGFEAKRVQVRLPVLVLSDVDNLFFDRENSSENTPHDESKSGTAIKEPSRSKPLSDPLWVSDTYTGVYYTLTRKGCDVTSPSGDFTLDQPDKTNSYRFV